MVKEYDFKLDGNNKISEHFLVKEFVAKGNLRTQYEQGKYSKILIDTDLINILETVRKNHGAVKITSGYRPEAYNKSVNGATSSYHIKGMAVDISVADNNLKSVARELEIMGVYGIGLYSSWVHFDTRPLSRKYLWLTEKQIPIKTFV